MRVGAVMDRGLSSKSTATGLVLIVDDDVETRRFLSALLSREGARSVGCRLGDGHRGDGSREPDECCRGRPRHQDGRDLIRQLRDSNVPIRVSDLPGTGQ